MAYPLEAVLRERASIDDIRNQAARIRSGIVPDAISGIANTVITQRAADRKEESDFINNLFKEYQPVRMNPSSKDDTDKFLPLPASEWKDLAKSIKNSGKKPDDIYFVRKNYGATEYQQGQLDMGQKKLTSRMEELEKNIKSKEGIAAGANVSKENIAAMNNETRLKISEAANKVKLIMQNAREQANAASKGDTNAERKLLMSFLQKEAKIAGDKGDVIGQELLQLRINDLVEDVGGEVGSAPYEMQNKTLPLTPTIGSRLQNAASAATGGFIQPASSTTVQGVPVKKDIEKTVKQIGNAAIKSHYKYAAKNPQTGQSIYSDDGKRWYDENGKPIQTR